MMSLRVVHSVYRKNYANSRQILFSIHRGIVDINKETTLMFRRVLYIIRHFVVGTFRFHVQSARPVEIQTKYGHPRNGDAEKSSFRFERRISDLTIMYQCAERKVAQFARVLRRYVYFWWGPIDICHPIILSLIQCRGLSSF